MLRDNRDPGFDARNPNPMGKVPSSPPYSTRCETLYNCSRERAMELGEGTRTLHLTRNDPVAAVKLTQHVRLLRRTRIVCHNRFQLVSKI
jgi:hypothetical protein